MNSNYQQEDMNELEISQRSDSYSSKKFKKIDILIFLSCLALAFVFWCYALYVDDPVIEKTLMIDMTLENGSALERIELEEIRVSVIGPRSELTPISVIRMSVDRSEFSEYDEYITVELQYPDGIDGNVREIKVKLVYDKDTDK